MHGNYSAGNTTPFVGRTKELADLSARLATPACRLLTVTGLGGSGKTRLALEAAKALAAHFPQGTFFVGLQPVIRGDLLVPSIAQAVGLIFYGEGESEAQLLEYLAEKALLLILDNFEHLLDEAELLNSILSHAPSVKILVTSRETLNLREEWRYPLKGLATPPSVYVSRDTLAEYGAVQLFSYHARRVRPDFDPISEHESIVRICNMTAGLPLAIELAASWLKGLSAAQIAQNMLRNLDTLSTTLRDVEPRHRSMRAVFDQSWHLLLPNERLIFARLSVFPGGFGIEAAHQVTGADSSDLALLVEKSLLQVELADRFTMHEMLRQYSTGKLSELGETEATYERLSRYYAGLMRRYEAGLMQPHQLDVLRAIERDFANIRLAWDWSVRNGQVPQLAAMLHGLYLFGFLRSGYRETIMIFQSTLEQPITDTPFHGRLLARRWGYLHWWYQADYGEALANIVRAREIAQVEDDRFEIAFCNLMAAYAMTNMHRYDEARTLLETSKAQFESINEPYYVCWVLHRLGYIYANLNNTALSTTYTEQSLALAKITHNHVAQVICLYNLGSDYILGSDYVRGRVYCAEALEVATQREHQGQIAHALNLLAVCDFCQGDFGGCREKAEQGRAIMEEINMLAFQHYSLSLLILLACRKEDYDEAARIREYGKRLSTNTMGYQLLHWALAALSCGLGNPREARVHAQELRQLSDRGMSSPTPTTWLAPIAACILAETDAGKATELLAWVFAYPDTAMQWARDWPLISRLDLRLRSTLSDEAYRMHRERGRAFSFSTVTRLLEQEFGAASGDNTQQLLTAREMGVLRLMASGLTNPQIAAELIIGAGTVKTHTLNIYRKLDVANRTQAITRARELSLLNP